MITKKPEIKTAGAKDENMMSSMNKQMMYFMPVLTVFIGMSLPGGLALYWFITTLLTALQQLYMFKKKDPSADSGHGEDTDVKGEQSNNVIEGEIVK